MTVINLHVSMGPGRDLQSDSHLLPDTLPTALRAPVDAISADISGARRYDPLTVSKFSFTLIRSNTAFIQQDNGLLNP